MATCSRSECDKTLRSNNTTGVCATGCHSPEAPPSIRAEAAGAVKAKPATSALAVATPATGGTALQRMRALCALLERDCDATLEAFAEAWLGEVRQKLDAAEDE